MMNATSKSLALPHEHAVLDRPACLDHRVNRVRSNSEIIRKVGHSCRYSPSTTSAPSIVLR